MYNPTEFQFVSLHFVLSTIAQQYNASLNLSTVLLKYIDFKVTKEKTIQTSYLELHNSVFAHMFCTEPGKIQKRFKFHVAISILNSGST